MHTLFIELFSTQNNTYQNVIWLKRGSQSRTCSVCVSVCVHSVCWNFIKTVYVLKAKIANVRNELVLFGSEQNENKTKQNQAKREAREKNATHTNMHQSE